MSLEKDLHAAMEEAYWRGGREAGYWGNYFLRSVRKNGGLETARRMLRPRRGQAVQKGLQALIDSGRPDLSVEALVLEPRFAPLFAAEELAEARRRLGDLFPRHAFRRRVPPEANFPEVLSKRRTYEEGAVSRVLVNRYERDPRARRACLRKHGMRCVCCGLDFEERYGTIGKGFIHVHHKKPLATSSRVYRLDPEKDLVPVCPNCHAMLHTSDPPLSVEELKVEISRAAGR